MDDMFLLIAIFGFVTCGIAGGLMLERVGRGGSGFMLGFLLGPIGLVIAWITRDNALKDEDERKRRHIPVAVKSVSGDLDELERLASLKERGHITPGEFEQKKREILASKS
jgi:hypothetical protein